MRLILFIIYLSVAQLANAFQYSNDFATSIGDMSCRINGSATGAEFSGSQASPYGGNLLKLRLTYEEGAIPGTSNGNYRSVCNTPGTTSRFTIGQDYWYGFNVNYNDWADDSDAEEFAVDIHEIPQVWTDSNGVGCGESSAWGVAPIFMAVQNGILLIRGYGAPNGELYSTNLLKNHWYRVKLHVRIAQTAAQNGLIEVWLDGVKVATHVGINYRAMDSNCTTTPLIAPRINFQIYKWDWRSGRVATQSTQRVGLIDNLKISNDAGAEAYVEPPQLDNTPPVISALANSAITDSSAVVSWSINESSTNKLVINGQTLTNSVPSTSASFSVTGLSPNMAYPYTATATDLTGNITNQTGTLTTLADTTPPVLTNVQVSDVTDTSATFTWTTNEPSSTRVKAYTSTWAGVVAFDATLVTNHTMTLTGLLLNTLMDFNARSGDSTVPPNLGNYYGTLTTLPTALTPPVALEYYHE